MDAVIYRGSAPAGTSMLCLAGTPLLLRQLQWLRSIGCDRVVVEACGEDSAAVDRLLEDPLGAMVTVVLTAAPVGPKELARRAGFAHDRSFLALRSDVVGAGDLSELFARDTGQGVVAVLSVPEGFSTAKAATVLLTKCAGSGNRAQVVSVSGWGLRVAGASTAWALSLALLEQRVQGLPVHGAELSPGVFRARGARVAPGATLVGPVFLGAGCVVEAGATVGPGAFLGARSIVQAGASVIDATVAEDTVVGEGLALRSCEATPEGVRAFSDEETLVPLGDALLLTGRSAKSVSGLGARFVALLLLLAVAPFVHAQRARGALRRWMQGNSSRPLPQQSETAWRLLLEVLLGTRAWVGVNEPFPQEFATETLLSAAAKAPRGVVSIEPALVPEGSDGATMLRAQAWYSLAKSPSTDASLLWMRLWGLRPEL